MKQTLKLSFEMTDVLSRIEHNGLKINLNTLDQIEKEYEDEMHVLENRLNELAKEAMGDTPINLASPDDKSMLLYSRKVNDKALYRTYASQNSRALPSSSDSLSSRVTLSVLKPADAVSLTVRGINLNPATSPVDV